MAICGHPDDMVEIVGEFEKRGASMSALWCGECGAKSAVYKDAADDIKRDCWVYPAQEHNRRPYDGYPDGEWLLSRKNDCST